MDAEPVKRSLEIEEATNAYVIHPISGLLVRLFARLGVSPNVVSLIGMACGIAAGVAYYHYHHLIYALLGFVLMVLWHVMDGADGQLARLTHAQSETGKILDGICDYVTFTSVYVGLAAALTRRDGGWIWALVVVAGICHAVQAAAYEVQRQDYNFWGLARTSAVLPDPSARRKPVGAATLLRRVLDALYRQYVRVQLSATGADMASRRRLEMLLAREPQREAVVRQCYRDVFAPAVHRWSLMSANYRTLAIFVFSAAKLPAWYFGFEIVILGAIFLALLAGQPALYVGFFERLERRATESETPSSQVGTMPAPLHVSS